MEIYGTNQLNKVKRYLVESQGDTNKNQHKHDASIWIVTGYVWNHRQHNKNDIKRMKKGIPKKMPPAWERMIKRNIWAIFLQSSLSFGEAQACTKAKGRLRYFIVSFNAINFEE